MDKPEEMHKLIDTNLTLLMAAGHRIDFTKRMFMERTPGFEAVGHALLMIIDAEECKRSIPWPLINDRVLTREFRTNFTKFIKMINSRYPEAKIPEITASSLEFPGGIKFIEFMYKLSRFALELELNRVMSAEDKEEHLSKPLVPEDSDDLKVQLSFVRVTLYRELESISRYKELASEESSMLKKMTECSTQCKTTLKSVSEQLRLEISRLNVEENTKASLLDITDTSAIKDYNERVEKKLGELEESSRRLKELDGLLDRCCQLSQQTPEDALCLDGRNLRFNRYIYELADEPVINVDGSIKLVEVFKAAQKAINRLTESSSSSDSLLTPTKDLLESSRSVSARAHKALSLLRTQRLEHQKAVEKLKPLVLGKIDPKKVEETLCLQELPPLNFILPKSTRSSKDPVKPRPRKSFGAVIRRKNTIVCTYKMRHDSKKHTSTPATLNTLSSRKCLNRTPPTRTKHKNKENKRPLKITFDESTPSTLNSPSTLVSNSLNCASNGKSTPQKMLPPRSSRKSINNVIERYLRLKQSMNTSSSSKNESCNSNQD